MNTGRRVLAQPDGSIVVEGFQPRLPGPNEVLIETEVTLISAGTELAMIAEPRSEAFCPGYSNVGRIVAIGDGVAGHRMGERVLSLGPHASHVTVPGDDASIAPVPTDVSSEEAAFAVLGSVAAHGVRKARLETGEHVLITGMGLVGQLALQVAGLAGCETLTAADLSEARLRIAHDVAGAFTVNPLTEPLNDVIERITDGCGLDCIIEASGYPDLLPKLFDVCRIGGRVILLGSIWHRTVEVDFMPFHLKELTLIGAHQPKCPTVATPDFRWTQQYNRRQFLRMIADGRIRVRPLLTHVLPVDEVAEAYRLLRQERDRALGVVLDFRT